MNDKKGERQNMSNSYIYGNKICWQNLILSDILLKINPLLVNLRSLENKSTEKDVAADTVAKQIC